MINNTSALLKYLHLLLQANTDSTGYEYKSMAVQGLWMQPIIIKYSASLVLHKYEYVKAGWPVEVWNAAIKQTWTTLSFLQLKFAS